MATTKRSLKFSPKLSLASRQWRGAAPPRAIPPLNRCLSAPLTSQERRACHFLARALPVRFWLGNNDFWYLASQKLFADPCWRPPLSIYSLSLPHITYTSTGRSSAMIDGGCVVARAGAQGVRGPGDGAAYAGEMIPGGIILAGLVARGALRASLAGPFLPRAVHPSHGAWPVGVACKLGSIRGRSPGRRDGCLGASVSRIKPNRMLRLPRRTPITPASGRSDQHQRWQKEWRVLVLDT